MVVGLHTAERKSPDRQTLTEPGREDTAGHTLAGLAVGSGSCSADTDSPSHKMVGRDCSSAQRRSLEVVEDIHSSRRKVLSDQGSLRYLRNSEGLVCTCFLA